MQAKEGAKEAAKDSKRIAPGEKIRMEEQLGQTHPGTVGLSGKDYSATGRKFLQLLLKEKRDQTFEIPKWEERYALCWRSGYKRVGLHCFVFSFARTTEMEETEREEKERRDKKKKGEKGSCLRENLSGLKGVCSDVLGLKLCREEDGSIHAEAMESETDFQSFGSYKAERLLHFSARSFALAAWGDLEAFTEFYEGMLQEFWTKPPDGFSGPSVDDLRSCEMAALKQTVRLVLSTGCEVEAALQTTVTNQV